MSLLTPLLLLTALLATPLWAEERLELDANGESFPALYRADSGGEALGGVILLHGANAHPDWPGVIGPLRRQLPALGWSTLSVQMPPLPSRSSHEQSVAKLLEQGLPRISTAVEELKGRGAKRIALIGHGLGALSAADYLAENLAAGVQGAVLVGIAGARATEAIEVFPRSEETTEEEGEAPVAEPEAEAEPEPEETLPTPRTPAELIELIALPLLDIYGQNDRDEVIARASERAAAARRNENVLSSQQFQRAQRLHVHGRDRAAVIRYRQIRVPGADHDFSDHGNLLVKRVHGWLKRHINAAP